MTASKSLKASLLLKIVLILIFLISLGFAIWLFLLANRTDTESQALGYYATSIGIILIVALVCKRCFDLCTVTLSEQGVEQLCIFSSGHFLLKKKLLWSEITNIAAKPGSFLFSGRGLKIEVNTMVFNNANEVIEFVLKKNPK
jgi:hypothetical protein